MAGPFGTLTFDGFKDLMGKAGPDLCIFALLKDSEKRGVYEGRARYSQHESIPVLDYRPAEYQRLNFGKRD